ncbi:fatty acid desaturase-domain-containing protein [Coniella lustricola]|uniref:Delta 8-(E)-sphingolipid desaturase n=1 Tax=Coniella lustricola TaxID=2025994 RepID=A0A2T3A7X9_9PEZI|nr:fatty acid desaturase-domain-containing protein [Coniella lustricola]
MATSTATPARSRAATTRNYPVVSRREVEDLIARGRAVFIKDQYVYKVDAWIKYHPGGFKAIEHMIGRDATDEVNALHSAETRVMMNRYRIGKIDHRWRNMVPPIQGGVFRKLGEQDADIDAAANDSVECPTRDSSDSSRAGSRPPSPIFDTVPHSDHSLRSRKAGTASPVSRPSSATSVTSAEDDEPLDGMSLLDRRTMQEIKQDLEIYPALDAATQDRIVKKYHELDQRIHAEGLYDCNYWAYAIECCRYTLFFGLFLLFLQWKWYAVSAFWLGCFWHQLTFTVHDAGHMGITHKFHTDSVIGILIADFLGGLSVGWWKRNHNVHHIVTNSPEHDPDIEHMPFFAISHRFLASLSSSYYERVMTYDIVAKTMLRIQHHSYYFILLFGRFNLYRLSWEYLLGAQAPRNGPAWWHRYLELTGHVFFWYCFGYRLLYLTLEDNWSRFVFVMVSHMVTMPLHVQITLSHFAMSTAELGPDESFPQKMLRTTMDVDCPQWLDFFHGGLQFQAIHHLFPRIPRHNLRATQKLVQQFCEDVGIPYALYGFVDGNKQVIGRLADVARQAAILAKCQQAIAESDDPLHYH